MKDTVRFVSATVNEPDRKMDFIKGLDEGTVVVLEEHFNDKGKVKRIWYPAGIVK